MTSTMASPIATISRFGWFTAKRRLAAPAPNGQQNPCGTTRSRYPSRPMTTEIQAAAEAPQSSPAISRSLFAFAIFYGGMVCIAGVLGNKQVALGPLSAVGPMLGLGPLAVEAGIFAFL